jgi:hypothetical protein
MQQKFVHMEKRKQKKGNRKVPVGPNCFGPIRGRSQAGANRSCKERDIAQPPRPTVVLRQDNIFLTWVGLL